MSLSFFFLYLWKWTRDRRGGLTEHFLFFLPFFQKGEEDSG
jgi:hypothetical protein